MSGYYHGSSQQPPYQQTSYATPDQTMPVYSDYGRPYQQGSSASRPYDAFTSPASNPHTGMHPSSYGQGIPFAAAALGANSSTSSSSLGMSISPPHWVPGNAPWASSGSYVGSFGALGTSFGRERDRELEAKYVRDFSCCGRQLNGLHALLEHYEEEHANLPPDARMAAINAVQAAASPFRDSAQPAVQHSQPMVSQMSLPSHSQQQQQHQSSSMAPSSIHGDVPNPPGMMDIEMDDIPPHQQPMPANFLQPRAALGRPAYSISAPPSPWAAAFRPQGTSTPPQCLPPSLLSYNPNTTTGIRTQQPIPLSTEELQAKAMRKAQRKAERAMAREEASTSDMEGEKRFPCPIEGCGKVYKQANGLKYHLTRSINSGHGNVAAMGGLAQFLTDKD